jgi:uroporphyrinogen decarboxylase
MTPKQRMLKAITHQSVDRIPTQINYTDAMGELMADHFGVDAACLPDYLGNHLLRVEIQHPLTLSLDKSIRFDWWGAGFSASEEGYFTLVNPLAVNRDLDRYAWPDPHRADLLDSAKNIIAKDNGIHFIVPNFGFALFERAWALRGLNQLLMDMVSDPQFVAELLDRITEIQATLIRRFIDIGVDGAYFGDDYGAQKGLLFSPAMWREFIKPRLASLFEPFKKRALPIIMHSDGAIQAILPDLEEIGLSVYNPVQPEVMDHNWLAETFAGRLSFYGGISTQSVLPTGSPEAVRSAVEKCAATLAPQGTSLVIGPSHRMMTDITMENVTAMLEAFAQLEQKP